MTTPVVSQTATPTGWQDLREWLDAVRAIGGSLVDVTGASSESDIGDATELLDYEDGSPAVLFDEIPGFAKGYRVLVNALGSRERQAVTLGLDPASATPESLITFWREMLRGHRSMSPVEVPGGPVMQNVRRDGEVDLERFPAPIWHPLDGGRYIGTASVDILRDPDTGRINAGTYRNQVFGPDMVGARLAPTHDGGRILAKYMARGEPCPIVIVAGVDPLLFLAACVEGLPFEENELAWAGGVRGRPIEVISGELTGLPIPAAAELVLEGFVTTDEFHKEGPFGEWMGYYHDGFERERVIRISRLYHRDDPIILGCPQGKPPHEDNRFLAYLRSAMIWEQMEHAGVPAISNVWSAPEGGNRLLTVVAIETKYVGHARQAGHIAAQCAAAVDMNRITIVVDQYVDVTSLTDVMWAVLTRVDPARDVDIIPGTKGSRIDMAMSPADRQLNTTSRMVIDATTPYGWKDDPLAGDIITDVTRSRMLRERWSWLLDRS